ncbi:MAG TPA: polysaccharide deacetylase family protein [Chloroflexaceae bacterium]|nr:polysaccharide deacetylase family protein [Chloroflexaceae bacterium]
MLKQLAFAAADSAPFAAFVALIEPLGDYSPDVLRVLTYHRVDEPGSRPSLDPGLISATPAAFAQQVSYLTTRYSVIGVEELIERVRAGRPLPPRAVLLTFDDAYCDFAEHAWPILRRHGAPVTLFVPTAYPDRPERAFWWDRLYQALAHAGRRDLETPIGRLELGTDEQRRRAYKGLRSYVKSRPHQEAMAYVEQVCAALGAPQARGEVLGWAALRELAREGVTLGAHTRTHPLLGRTPLDEVRAEVAGSLRDLEREIGHVHPTFAYPSGSWTDDVERVLEQEGVALGFTTDPGLNDLREGRALRLRRLNVSLRASLPLLRARLLGPPRLGPLAR